MRQQQVQAQYEVVPVASVVVAPGWRYDDDESVTVKLQASLGRYGQLRPLVVYRASAGGDRLLVAGRGLLKAMQALGWTEALAVDLGVLGAAEVVAARLALEVCYPTDYSAVAQAVAEAVAAGASVDHLASVGPFTGERLRHFVTLSTFDWAQFKQAGDGQAGLAWDAEDEAGLDAAAEPPLEPVVAVAVSTPPLEPKPVAVTADVVEPEKKARTKRPMVVPTTTSTGDQMALWD